MYKELKVKIGNTLKAEAEYIQRSEKDTGRKAEKLSDILHLIQIIENFEELEPVIAEYINKKAQKEKYKNER